MTGIYAIGLLGGVVRLVMQTDQDTALAQRQGAEVCCLLNGLPLVPVMITADGSDVVPVPPTLDELRDARWDEAKAYRDARMDGGCLVDLPGGRVMIDTDDDARAKLNGATSGAMIAGAQDVAFSVDWTMADNSVVSLDGPGLMAVAMQVLTHVSACQTAGTAVRLAIGQAADADGVAAVDVAAGYP